jgi:hypothetical protein
LSRGRFSDFNLRRSDRPLRPIIFIQQMKSARFTNAGRQCAACCKIINRPSWPSIFQTPLNFSSSGYPDPTSLLQVSWFLDRKDRP